MTRHTPCFFTLGERNFFKRPFTRTLKTSYGCGRYTLAGRETGSDKPGRAKTICRDFILSILRAILSVAVTPRGGADCDDPCHLSWYFCRKTAALKNGRTHHPCLRKNRGRLLWCPWDVTDIPLPAERQPHLCFKTTSIGAIDTMRRNRPLCQQTANLCRFPPYACIAPLGFKGGLKIE